MDKEIYLLSPTPRDSVISLPIIKFSEIYKDIDFSICDTLMFTSKQAVITVNNIDKKWKSIPAIAIGKATKNQIDKLGGEVIYQPHHFYGEELSKDIVNFFCNRNILYLRPETISFDSKAYLKKKNILLHEQIIYKTSCIKYNISSQPPIDSIIIFTSPSTIKCFLNNFQWIDSYMAIVIGNATKSHLPPNAQCLVADEPLISSCIKKAYDYKPLYKLNII
ncbi:MAG: uroporphyrinogen-III synthase [Sulfurovum sp.]|nr:uroporphyrinogen-III synthase [Sulfurovaceae bacterium]